MSSIEDSNKIMSWSVPLTIIGGISGYILSAFLGDDNALVNWFGYYPCFFGLLATIWAYTTRYADDPPRQMTQDEKDIEKMKRAIKEAHEEERWGY